MRLDSWQEMCHSHGGWHSASSFCFAVLTQADVHPRVGHRLVSVVVVGEELLSELTLVVVMQLGETGERQMEELFKNADCLKAETKQRCRDIIWGGIQVCIVRCDCYQTIALFLTAGAIVQQLFQSEIYRKMGLWSNEWCERSRTRDTMLSDCAVFSQWVEW